MITQIHIKTGRNFCTAFLFTLGANEFKRGSEWC